MMFEVFSKEVEIAGEKYRIRPLTGRFIKPFYDVLKAFSEFKGDESEDFIASLNPETMESGHMLAMETFRKAYPKEDVEKLEEWVSQNLVNILPAVLEVNLPQVTKE